MKEIKVYIYEFEELDADIQQFVIAQYIEELIEFTDFEEDIEKDSGLYEAYKKCKELKTPWFLSGMIWQNCKEEIIESVKCYEYYKNGERYIEE